MLFLLLLHGIVSLSIGATPDEICKNNFGESTTAQISSDTPCVFTCSGFSRVYTVEAGSACNLPNSQDAQQDGAVQGGLCYNRQCMTRQRYEDETSGRRDGRRRNNENEDGGRRRGDDDGGRGANDNSRNRDSGRRGGGFFGFFPNFFQSGFDMFTNMLDDTAHMASGFIDGAADMLDSGSGSGRSSGGSGKSSGIGRNSDGGKTNNNGIGAAVA